MDIVEQLLEEKKLADQVAASARTSPESRKLALESAALRGFAADVITELRDCVRRHVPETEARKMLSFSEAEAIFGPKEA